MKNIREDLRELDTVFGKEKLNEEEIKYYLENFLSIEKEIIKDSILFKGLNNAFSEFKDNILATQNYINKNSQQAIIHSKICAARKNFSDIMIYMHEIQEKYNRKTIWTKEQREEFRKLKTHKEQQEFIDKNN